MKTVADKSSMTLRRCNTLTKALMDECPGREGVWMLSKEFGRDADTSTNTDESPCHLQMSAFVEVEWEAPIEEHPDEQTTDTESTHSCLSQRIEIEVEPVHGGSSLEDESE